MNFCLIINTRRSANRTKASIPRTFRRFKNIFEKALLDECSQSWKVIYSFTGRSLNRHGLFLPGCLSCLVASVKKEVRLVVDSNGLAWKGSLKLLRAEKVPPTVQSTVTRGSKTGIDWRQQQQQSTKHEATHEARNIHSCFAVLSCQRARPTVQIRSYCSYSCDGTVRYGRLVD